MWKMTYNDSSVSKLCLGKAFHESNDKITSHEKEEIKSPLGKVKKIGRDYLQRLVNFILI